MTSLSRSNGTGGVTVQGMGGGGSRTVGRRIGGSPFQLALKCEPSDVRMKSALSKQDGIAMPLSGGGSATEQDDVPQLPPTCAQSIWFRNFQVPSGRMTELRGTVLSAL